MGRLFSGPRITKQTVNPCAQICDYETAPLYRLERRHRAGFREFAVLRLTRAQSGHALPWHRLRHKSEDSAVQFRYLLVLLAPEFGANNSSDVPGACEACKTAV